MIKLRMVFQIIAVLILLVFYGCYFIKMISQQRRDENQSTQKIIICPIKKSVDAVDIVKKGKT